MRIRLFILLMMFSSVTFAQDDTQLRKTYQDAEEEYKIGHFEAAAGLLNKNIGHYRGTLKTSAFRLIALCLLAQDNNKEAEKYVSLMLKDDPYYNVTIQDPVRFAQIVNNMKNGLATITTTSQQAETLDEVPVPVTLITEDMIKASGARTLSDVLAIYVLGVSLIESTEPNMAMHGVYSNSQ